MGDPTCRNVEFFFQYFTEYLDFSGTKNTDPSKGRVLPYYHVDGTNWRYDKAEGGRAWLQKALPQLAGMFERKIMNCELPYRLPVFGTLPKPEGRKCKPKPGKQLF